MRVTGPVPRRRPDPDSLDWARRGRVIALVGGSNVAGADTGQFGTNANVKPAAVALYLNGTTPASDYAAIHGPEVGIVLGLQDAGLSLTGLTIVKRAVAGASMSDFYSGGSPYNTDITSYCTTLGVTPTAICGIVPGADTTTSGLGTACEGKYPLAFGPLVSAWSVNGVQPGLILTGPAAADGHASYAGAATGRVTAKKWTQTERTGVRAYTDVVALEHQTDAAHLTSVGQIAWGRAIAALLVKWGVYA